jgi:hypothetical protein
MENKSIKSLKKIVGDILREHISQKEMINEAPISVNVLGSLIRKLESSYGDDVARFFERSVAKSGRNIFINAQNKVFLRSSVGTEVSLSKIERAINAGLHVDDITALLPDKLADGTEFRSIVSSKMKRKIRPINLGARLNASQMMSHAESDPFFSYLLENKKGLRGKLENYLDLNFPNGATSDELMNKLRPYFESAERTPNKPNSVVLSKVYKFFKNEDGWKLAKSGTKWYLGIGLMGVVGGLWTGQELLQNIICKLPSNENIRQKFGCDASKPDDNKKPRPY